MWISGILESEVEGESSARVVVVLPYRPESDIYLGEFEFTSNFYLHLRLVGNF